MSTEAAGGPDPAEVEAWLSGQEAPEPAACSSEPACAAASGSASPSAASCAPSAAPPAQRLASAATQALPLAHALRQAGHAAWSSEPQRAVQAAAALRRLQSRVEYAGAKPGGPALTELRALADWADGIAKVTAGHLDDALADLLAASAALQAIGRALLAAQAQVPQVMVLTLLGQHADAAATGQAASDALHRLGDTLSAAKIALNLGSLHLYRDDYPAAREHYRLAAVRFARSGDVEHSVMADIGLGDALTAQGELDEADRIYDRAAMRAGTHALPVLQALAAESSALLALARGRHAAALQGLESARTSYARLGLDTHCANAEQHLGDAYLELRLLPEALTLLDGALQRLSAQGLPDEQAWTQMRRGRVLAAMARPDEAELALRDAGALFASQGSDVGQGHVALARSALALSRGEAAPALALAGQAHERMRASGQAEGLLAADAAAAEALLAVGRYRDAQERFKRVLAKAQARQRLPLQVQAHTGLGLVAEAESERPEARRQFGLAVARFEAMRRSLPGDDLRSAFLADHLRPYDGLLRLALAEWDPARPDSAAAVLIELERSRARALGERLLPTGSMPRPMGDAPAERPADAGDAQTAQAGDAAQARQAAIGAAELRARLHWLYGRQRQLDFEGERSQTLEAEIRRAEQALLADARRTRVLNQAGGGAAAAARADDARADEREIASAVAALPAALAPDEALVEFGVCDGELLACIVRPQGVELVRHLASWADTLQAVQGLQFQMDALRHGADAVQAHLPLLTRRAEAHLQRIRGLVWSGLETRLKGVRQLLVAPVGPLAGLPHSALLSLREPGAGSTRSMAGGATAPALEPASGPIVALVSSARLALHGILRPVAPLRRVVAFGHDRQLLHAEAEARAVAAAWPEGQACTGLQASRDSLCTAAPQADLLHLACHAVFRQDSPQFSALHLADGALTAEQVEQWQLPAQLVVLSACETALADGRRGDERFGLVRSFLLAGAARVVASLWPVDDAVTASLMQGIHQSLREGHSPAQALHLAQAALRATHPHPHFWAGFTVHGGW